MKPCLFILEVIRLCSHLNTDQSEDLNQSRVPRLRYPQRMTLLSYRNAWRWRATLSGATSSVR
jgi:hypothetical protein